MTEVYQVKPDDKLLRWLHPGQFNWEENRPTSAAFKDENMSVDILCHALIIGKKTKSIAKFLAENSEVEIYPPN